MMFGRAAARGSIALGILTAAIAVPIVVFIVWALDRMSEIGMFR